MKKSVILILLAAAVVAGAIVYLNKSKAPAPAPQPVAQAAPQTTEAAPAEVVAPAKADPQPAAPVKVAQPAPAAVATSDTNAAAAPTNSISKAIDALLSARHGKHEMFQELLKSGQLDAAIAELQQRKAANPNDPEISTTLGEALLNKVRVMHDSGTADVNDMGILAMQADQNFNAALKQDPNNWEAQYVKYSSMSYWPADPSRDSDIVQHLSSLIDHQAGQASQPEFVQPYLALIRQYQKMGMPNEAAATYKLAIQQFPGNSQLLQFANGQP